MVDRRSPLRRTFTPIALLVTLALLALSHAQSLVVEAPAGRLAQPGDYVTLVFLVRSASDMTVVLDGRSSHGWQLLGPTSPVTLSAGSTQPVAVTAAVPPTAAAGDPDVVTLTAVGGGHQASASTEIEVAQHLDLQLQAPAQVVVGQSLDVTIANAGNVTTGATVSASVDGQTVGSRDVTVRPGKQVTLSFPVSHEGRYRVRLLRNDKVVAVRFVDTVVHGLPKPATFTLAGTASANLDTDGLWGASIAVKGALSDEASLDANLRADAPLRSHIALQTTAFGARLGDLSSDPLGLPPVQGFGVSAMVAPGSYALEGSAAWLEGPRYAGRIELGYRRAAQNLSLVGGLGMTAGKVAVAARMSGTVDHGSAVVRGSYDGQSVAASYRMQASDATGNYSVGVILSDALSDYGRLSFTANYVAGHTAAFAVGTVPLGAQAAGMAQVGGETRLASLDSGSLGAAAALGDVESYARVSFDPSPQRSVRPSGYAGLVYRPQDLGWGVAFDARLALGSASGAHAGWSSEADLRGRYFPGSDAIRGRLSLRTLGNLAPATVFGSVGWDLGTGTLSVGTGTILTAGPWTFQLNAGGQYAPASTVAWSAQLGLQARWAFDLPVPEAVVQATGGRRLGTVVVQVSADGEPVAGVPIAVGRYRIQSDPGGSVTLRLPPGRETVSVDLRTLAANMQLVGPSSQTVEIQYGTTVHVAFRLRRTAAVEGRVLSDSNGDGVADAPERGVAATVLVRDAGGQSQVVHTRPDGTFVVRGLPKGPTRVQVVKTPPGSAVVGRTERHLTLTAGGTSTVQFLVQPAAARATTFGGGGLTIRDVRPEVDAAPPGSAPLVTVTTTGHPERVELLIGSRTFEAKRGPDGTWTARIRVPPGAAGVVTFRVRAVRGGSAVSRGSQLVVSGDVPLMSIGPIPPLRAGTSATLSVHVLFAATSVTSRLGDEAPVTLTETSPGRWTARIRAPATSDQAEVPWRITAHRSGGESAVLTKTLRVLPH